MHQERTLAAIVFTDIVGYTAIMGADEDVALALIEENKQIHQSLVAQYHGRYVKEIGDGTLATFPTASDAVECALEIQKAVKGKYKLRIGIHFSEIVVAEDDVFGDGVNIASRIEQIAPSGGIYMSEAVFRAVHDLKQTNTRFEGDILFKNVHSPTKIYAVLSEHLTTPERNHFKKRKELIEKRTFGFRSVFFSAAAILLLLFLAWQFTIGRRPDISAKTIAVLPFESRGDQDEYFSSGITEDIVNQLIKIHELKIIDRSNLRSYDYQSKSYSEIGFDLDVANLLVGTITKDSNNVRISARLINAETEEILWAESYNEPFEDIFQIQNNVAISIAEKLKAKVSENEAVSLNRLPTTNMNAYDLYWKGREYYSRYTEADNLSSIELYRQALDLDPKFSLAYAGLSDAYSQLAQKSNIKDIWLDSAYHYASIVKSDLPSNSVGYKSMGLYYSIIGNTSKAIEEFTEAVRIDNNVEAVINLSRLYYRTGELEQALKLLINSQWYHPMNADLWFNFGATYYRLKDFEKCEEYLEKALFINPNHINSLLLKWFTSVLTNNNEEAFTVAQRLGYIGDDDTDKLLMILQEVVQNNDPSMEQAAQSIVELLEEREVDYIEIPYLFNLIGYVYYQGGLQSRARALFEYKMKYNLLRMEQGDTSYKLRYELAQIQATLGNVEDAMHWFHEAFLYGWSEFPFASMDPTFRNLRSNQKFNKIIEGSMHRLDSIQLELTSMEGVPSGT